MTQRAIARAVLLTMALGACKERGDEPLDPVWGKEPCAHCSMLVSDRRAAAEVIDANGMRYWFDDVGCMVVWMSESKAPPSHAWVRAPSADGWREAATARYVSEQRTPMNYGYVAAGSSEQGVSFDQMRSAVLAYEASLQAPIEAGAQATPGRVSP